MSKKKKQREAELREQERILMLQQVQAAEAAAAKEEEERRKNRPIAMEEYYNIAYAKERQRLNEMFGRINYGIYPDEPTTVEKVVYKEPDTDQFVPMEKYKKKKGGVAALTVTTLLFAGAAIFFALVAFGILSI